jgi:cytoplasmic iron level regulating protein YaaA (DUF328/UPF0246 family)
MIIISPAKKQVEHYIDGQGVPSQLQMTAELANILQEMSVEDLAKHLKISMPLAKLNQERLQAFSIDQIKQGHAAAAIYTYQGDVYQNLDVDSLSEQDVEYLQNNVRMISAFYGLLKPLDGILPYRLEMVSRLPEVGDLAKLWSDSVTQALKNEEIIFNLASNEYAKTVNRHQMKRWVDITFLDQTATGYKFIAVKAKRMRGRLLRYMIQNQITQPEQLQDFSEQGYVFDSDSSNNQLIQFKNDA